MLALSVVLHWYVKTTVKSLATPANKSTASNPVTTIKPKLAFPVKQTVHLQRSQALLARRVPHKAVTPK